MSYEELKQTVPEVTRGVKGSWLTTGHICPKCKDPDFTLEMEIDLEQPNRHEHNGAECSKCGYKCSLAYKTVMTVYVQGLEPFEIDM